MRFQRTMVLSGVLLLAGAAAPAQEAQPQATPPVIRSETKLVLVDVVVTGKKGVYVEDLELKNFKVWEDNKEQQLKTFSSGADPNGPGGQKRYIVLFFDNSTMAAGEQSQVRQAAARFIESNAGPDRLIAVVNFTELATDRAEFHPRYRQTEAGGGQHQNIGHGSRTASREPGRAAVGQLRRIRSAQHAAGPAGHGQEPDGHSGTQEPDPVYLGIPVEQRSARGGECGHRHVQQSECRGLSDRCARRLGQPPRDAG